MSSSWDKLKVDKRTDGVKVVTIPLRTRSIANSREHWAQLWKRRQRQSFIVCRALRVAKVWPVSQLRAEQAANDNGVPWPLSKEGVPIIWRVHLVRLAPRLFDSDNFVISLKAVRDAVALYLCLRDGPNDPIEWTYEQIKQPRVHAVRIECELLLLPEQLGRYQRPPRPSVIGC